MSTRARPKWRDNHTCGAAAVAFADVIYIAVLGPALISAKDSVAVCIGIAVGAFLIAMSIYLVDLWRKSHV